MDIAKWVESGILAYKLVVAGLVGGGSHLYDEVLVLKVVKIALKGGDLLLVVLDN